MNENNNITPDPRVLGLIRRTRKPHITMINGLWVVAATPVFMNPVAVFLAFRFIEKLNSLAPSKMPSNHVFENGQRGLI